MKFKKFILIPIIFFLLIFLYVNFINSLSERSELVKESHTISKSRTGEAIGVGQAVSIKVTRANKPYLFGLIDLPAYVQGIGSLIVLHTIFFWSLYTFTTFLTTVFLIIERRDVNMVKPPNLWKDNKANIWLRLGKSIGIGALFALVAFLISGDNSSLAFGLLVAYLEFRHSSG